MHQMLFKNAWDVIHTAESAYQLPVSYWKCVQLLGLLGILQDCVQYDTVQIVHLGLNIQCTQYLEGGKGDWRDEAG